MNPTRLFFVLLAGCALLLSACSPPASQSDGGGTGWIAYTSTVDGDREIYALDARRAASEARQEPLRLTDDPADDGFAAWSPDGARLAFVTNRLGNADIFLLEPGELSQGSPLPEAFPLVQDSAEDFFPAWSPDGKWIAFLSDRDGDFEIYLLEVEAYLERPDEAGLTRLTDNDAGEFYVAWSPDGAQLVFQTDRDGDFEIYVMDRDGSGQRNLTNHPGGDGFPVWSPDGSRIAFNSDRDGNFEIYVMDSDGANQANLTADPSSDVVPAWSPDGSRLAFASNRDGDFEVYLMDPAGAGVARLTDNLADDRFPVWQP